MQRLAPATALVSGLLAAVPSAPDTVSEHSELLTESLAMLDSPVVAAVTLAAAVCGGVLVLAALWARVLA